jgi:hypothetical protein
MGQLDFNLHSPRHGGAHAAAAEVPKPRMRSPSVTTDTLRYPGPTCGGALVLTTTPTLPASSRRDVVVQVES